MASESSQQASQSSTTTEDMDVLLGSDSEQDTTVVPQTPDDKITSPSAIDATPSPSPDEKSTSPSADAKSTSPSAVHATPSPSPDAPSADAPSADEKTSTPTFDARERILELQKLPHAKEVIAEGAENLMEHDSYAELKIAATKVHFRLRRSNPTLYRHAPECYHHIRTFKAIDDAVRIAAPGVKWSIQDQNVVVLQVGCLGYRDTTTSQSRRSAKIDDRRPTMVIVRDVARDGDPITFDDMRVISAAKLFREGVPYSSVDVAYATEMEKEVQAFLLSKEPQPYTDGKTQETHKWLEIKPLLRPSPIAPPTQTSSPSPEESFAASQRQLHSQKKK